MKVDSLNASVLSDRKQSIQKDAQILSHNNYVSQPSFSNYGINYPRPVLGMNNSQVSFKATIPPVKSVIPSVMSFAEAVADKMIVGGKGYGLVEMTKLGIPVPPGFIIPIPVCDEFKILKKLPDGLMEKAMGALKKVEDELGCTFGGTETPLFVSVRSGAPVSMPGMMDTILNVGMNDTIVEAFAKQTNNERFAYDSYRRLIQMFGSTTKDINKELFEDAFSIIKKEYGVIDDNKLSAEGMKKVVSSFKDIYKQETGSDFPQDVKVQLKDCIETVFRSSDSQRAIDFKRISGIDENMGTAVTVQAMRFGNMGDTSATGVAFSRHPKTGERVLTGDYLTNAQGEDVVAGIRQTKQMSELEKEMPAAYEELVNTINTLEKHNGDMQDTEFTIQEGKLWMLQTRNGKRTPGAVARIAVEMVEEGRITKQKAIANIPDAKMLLNLQFPVFDDVAKKEAINAGKFLAKGTDCAGCATGEITFNPDRAVKLKEEGKKVILVRHETSPNDIHGMNAADGILTTTGGRTSHAAVVAMGMGKPAIVGCGDLHVNEAKGIMEAGTKIFKEGDVISIDGNTGEVFEGAIKTIPPTENPYLDKIISWAGEIKGLTVKVNADTPEDAAKAIKLGAEGIGLTRTEHMFMDQERLPSVQKMLLAEMPEERMKYINELLPMQREDFAGIFEAMDGKPVTVRLIDPPIHEFLPKRDDLLKDVIGLRIKNKMCKIFRLKNGKNIAAKLEEKEALLKQVEKHTAVNPMMATRGCRLGITYPEITEMQTRALMEAACDVKAKGIDVQPEIMVPNVAIASEFKHQKTIVDRVAKQVMAEKGVNVDYKVGTMVETPSAAFCADELVKEGAEFFSFGTNDLTQFTLGLDREEQKLIETYIKSGIFKTNPFNTIHPNVAGVMKVAVEKGRSVDPNLKIGICGEHGGDPESIKICQDLGLTSVSASPLRLATAEVAAAQAEMKAPGKAHRPV